MRFTSARKTLLLSSISLIIPSSWRPRRRSRRRTACPTACITCRSTPLVTTFQVPTISSSFRTVLHGLGEKASRKLIKRLYQSVNPGGSLVIQAQFMRDDRLGSRWPIFLDLVQLCVTNEGRNHAPGETARWLEDAGFTDVEYERMTLLNTNSLLRGYKR